MTILKIIRSFCVATILSAAAAPAQQPHPLQAGFVSYAGVQSVTGREERFVEFLKEHLPAGVKAETDNMGSLVVRLGAGEPGLLVVTSIDEPGYLVTNVTQDGYLMVNTPARGEPNALYHQFHEGHYVDIAIEGGSRTVRGVVAIPSSHIFRGRRENLTPDRMLIDVGARSQQEAFARGIQILDPLTAVKDAAVLSGNRVAGPMLSRKVGAFALMQVLKSITAGTAKSMVFAWATQSYLRNSGVMRLARECSPRQVLVVGSFERLEDRRSGTVEDPVDVLGSGVLIPKSGLDRSGLLASRFAQAQDQGLKLTPSSTGLLPEVRAFEGSGVEVLPLAIAVKYPGSLVEVIDFDDLDQLIRLLTIILE